MLNVEIDITEVTDQQKTLTAKITIKSVNDIRAMLKLTSVATFVLLEGEYFLFNAWIAIFRHVMAATNYFLMKMKTLYKT